MTIYSLSFDTGNLLGVNSERNASYAGAHVCEVPAQDYRVLNPLIILSVKQTAHQSILKLSYRKKIFE